MAPRIPPGDPRLAIAYLRVSTEDQKLGPDAQRAAIDAWATHERVEVIAAHVDTTSGGADIAERPALVAALGELRARRAGILVVAKRDRLARDVVIAAMIERATSACGARVVSADGAGNGETPADAFMRTILDAAAAYERALIRARTRAALAAKRAKSELVGAVPYGYVLAADGVRLMPQSQEQVVIAIACELRTAGRPLRAVAAELTARGFRARNGKPFVAEQVARMLRQVPAVIGLGAPRP